MATTTKPRTNGQPATTSSAHASPVVQELRERLTSLDQNCLTGLAQGLDAMVAGDLTQAATPVTKPIDSRSGDEDIDALVDIFNSMLDKAVVALTGYNAMREELRSALGDRNCLEDLSVKLKSLDGNCLTNLGAGLDAMVEGDLTVEVLPVTNPVEGEEGANIGELAETFNSMLAKAQAGLGGYNTVRETMRSALGDQSCLEDLQSRMNSLESNCLANLENALEAMNNGDLTIEVTPVTTLVEAEEGKEIGELAGIFNNMLGRAQTALEGYNAMREKVAGMIREISATSGSVAAASQQMASTSEETGRAIDEIAQAVTDVAQGAERQVRSVESANEVTREMVQATEASAQNAAETVSAAEAASSVASEGADAVAQATEAMEAVKESSAQATTAIRHLGSKSEQIGGIVDTITAIAQQTNLLALNAAIEAARAGEQGRGFAVVAEEVRKLAEESQQAAGTIASLIREIQSETLKAVEVVEGGGAKTEEGASTVEQAREAFNKIQGSVEDMNTRVTAISAAIEQITASATKVQEDITEVASVAEQSSAASEEVSASTEETSASTQEVASSAGNLAQTAEELERLVGQFTLA